MRKKRQGCCGFPSALWLLSLLAGMAVSAALWAASDELMRAADSTKGEGTASAAKEEPAPKDERVRSSEGATPAGYYVSLGWFLPCVAVTFAWLWILDWTAKDAHRVGTNEALWNSVVLAAGLGGLALVLFIHKAFLLTMLVAVGGVFGGYVWTRNQIVTPEQRVLTPEHLAFLLSGVLAKLGIKVSPGTIGGARQDMTRIVLMRKDGKRIEALAEDSRAQGHSQATLAVKEMIENAVLSRATDIHIEPKENEVQVRFRIDGILHNAPSYPIELGPAMLSCIKVLSDMDIAEKRKPQDGTFAGQLEGRTLDFRCATTPSVHGETMVIRILDRDQGIITLDKLGLSPRDKQRLIRIINAPHGMLIVSGPTGSGKTTTLYAALNELDAFQKNIMTIENPIEYRLDNVTQTAVNPKQGVTFATALRSMLRQDPDVIMVGEVRDAETAQTALQAAMTGHFVFTTIHANDSVTSLFRLLDLGVEPYLIASALTAVLAQRLVRVLCNNCKVPYVPKADFLRQVGLSPDRVTQFYKAQGCEACQGTGYKGRTGIFELFELNDVIKDLVRGNPSIQLIKAEARKAGLVTLVEDGLSKVVAGITSIKELMRVTK